MGIVVTGTYMPTSVAASVLEGEQRVVILHVPRHVSMIRACMQHSDLIDAADVALRTFGLDIAPGRYDVLELDERGVAAMAAFTARTGAVHRTTPADDLGHVVLNARAVAALGRPAKRIVGDAPPQAHRS